MFQIRGILTSERDPDPWICTLDSWSGSGSGSCAFRQWPSRCQQKFFKQILFLLLSVGTFKSSKITYNSWNSWKFEIKVFLLVNGRIQNQDRYRTNNYGSGSRSWSLKKLHCYKGRRMFLQGRGVDAAWWARLSAGSPHQWTSSLKQDKIIFIFSVADPPFFHPGSEFFQLGSRILIKEFKYFNKRNGFLAQGNMIRVVHHGSGS